MQENESINRIRNTQSQRSLAILLERDGLFQLVNCFTFKHYNSVYDASLHGWCKSRSYTLTDLNDAKNMACEAIRCGKP